MFVRNLLQKLHDCRSSLPHFVWSCSIMRDGDPFLFWLVQELSSQLAPSVIGMAKLQCHQLAVPKQEKKTGLWPIRPICAVPVRALKPLAWPALVTVACGEGEDGWVWKSRHHQPPASPHPPPQQPTETNARGAGLVPPQSVRRIVGRGEFVGIHSGESERGPAPAFFFPVVLVGDGVADHGIAGAFSHSLPHE